MMFFAAVCVLLLCGVSASSTGYKCKIIPGKLVQIDANSDEVYGVNANDDVYRRKGNDWKQLPGKLTHITAGPSKVYGVNRGNQIYKFQNNDWITIPGSLKQIDAGGDRCLCGVNRQDNIYCSRLKNAHSAVSWVLLDGSLKYYCCGPYGCWGVNSADNIYFRHGVTKESCQGTHWQQIEGSLVMIKVGTDGSVYGVNSAGNLYRRDGIRSNNPTGTSWTRLDLGYNCKHVTYDKGHLWLITRTNDIVKCDVRN